MARARTTKNLIGKLQDAGEEALAKVAEAPGVGRVVESASGMKDRLDDLTLRVRGLEGIDKRLNDLEKKVEQLAKAQKAHPAKPSAAKPSRAKAAPKKTPAKKPDAVAGP